MLFYFIIGHYRLSILMAFFFCYIISLIYLAKAQRGPAAQKVFEKQLVVVNDPFEKTFVLRQPVYLSGRAQAPWKGVMLKKGL